MLAAGLAASFVLVARGHSHNDYWRPAPLQDALAAGFGSVEADVFLVEGRLLVAHERATLKPERTLRGMYLAPLAARIREQGGWVYSGHEQTFWVLVDIKADGEAAYARLKGELNEFPELAWNPARPAIRFVVSGDRPVSALVNDKGAFAGLDGRWADRSKGFSAGLMPWISEAWGSHFSWRGSGEFAEGQKLAEMVSTVQGQGRKIRFWGSPDGQPSWLVQWKAGVDLINTDRPAALRKYILGLGEQLAANGQALGAGR